MKKLNDMQRLKDHLEKNWGVRIEYLKYQIYVTAASKICGSLRYARLASTITSIVFEFMVCFIPRLL